MKRLETKDAETLYYEPQRKTKQFVEGLIPQGLNTLCGSSKIGKSWLMLWLCLHIADGSPVWGREVIKTDALYLCLEDTYTRIQERLYKLTDSPPDNLRFALMCGKIGNGLEEQIEGFLAEYPKTKFIVIDTLQKVRQEVAGSMNAYGHDYSELSALKTIADNYEICILFVHHSRKLEDASDPINNILGSTGISGTVDSIFILKKDKRFSNNAVLYVVSRDVEQQELTLRFEDYVWQLVECKGQAELQKETIPNFLFWLVDFMEDKTEWNGSASELLSEMKISDLKPNIASKYLSQFFYQVLQPAGINFETHRTGKGRTILLWKSDDSVGDDGKISYKKTSSQPSSVVT